MRPTLRVREAGSFWARCARGRRHRVTAFRVVQRSPDGPWVTVRTRLSLACGGEVRRLAHDQYEADGLGPLLRDRWCVPTAS